MSGDELDDAIDAAVRDIMRAEGPPGLRQRVLRRLAAPEPRRFAAVPRLAVVAAVVVAVAIGALVARRGPAAPATRIASAPRSAPGPARPNETASVTGTAAANRPAPVPNPVASRTVADRHARSAPADRLVSATSLVDTDSSVTITPLDPMRTIAAAPVESDPLHMEAIVIPPLQTESVRIDPLSSTPR